MEDKKRKIGSFKVYGSDWLSKYNIYHTSYGYLYIEIEKHMYTQDFKENGLKDIKTYLEYTDEKDFKKLNVSVKFTGISDHNGIDCSMEVLHDDGGRSTIDSTFLPYSKSLESFINLYRELCELGIAEFKDIAIFLNKINNLANALSFARSTIFLNLSSEEKLICEAMKNRN